MGLNQFPSLPDKFFPSSHPDDEQTTKTQEKSTTSSTASPPSRKSSRSSMSSAPNTRLCRVYVLRNGWGWWLNSLRNELQKDGWDSDLVGSADVKLDAEQGYAGMAVDMMAVAEKAKAFVFFFSMPSFYIFRLTLD